MRPAETDASAIDADGEPLRPHRIDRENAEKIWGWLQTRGGLSLWRSVDLSNPGKGWTCPRRDANGAPVEKPSWQADSKPYRVITDPKDVIVETYREVKRFRIAIKRGSGLSLVLTDAASARVRREQEKAGPNATYTFEENEAVIWVPASEVPLDQWAAQQGWIKPEESAT